MSFITDADSPTGTIAMATAEARTCFTNVNVIYSPALPLTSTLFLDPPELRRTTGGET